jgi:hypothetical protein
MKAGFLRLTAAAVAVVASTFATPAGADVAVFVGTGSITGLPAVGCTNDATINISGTAVNSGPTFPTDVYTIEFQGTSTTCESILAGAGFGDLIGFVNGTVGYVRNLGVVTLSGEVFVGEQGPEPLLAVCQAEPTSAEPITTFAMECAISVG